MSVVGTVQCSLARSLALDMLRKAVMKRLLLRRKRPTTTPRSELPKAEVGGAARPRESMADLSFAPHQSIAPAVHEFQVVGYANRLRQLLSSTLIQNHLLELIPLPRQQPKEHLARGG